MRRKTLKKLSAKSCTFSQRTAQKHRHASLSRLLVSHQHSHCYMTSFAWWHTDDILKSLSDREGFVRLMSPHFIPPPPLRSYLPFPSCTVALLGLFSSTKWNICPIFFLFFLYIQDVGPMHAFFMYCIWHRSSPSSEKQDDTTLLLLLIYQTRCRLPALLVEERRTGNEPMGFIH